jgi:hypothetical protein
MPSESVCQVVRSWVDVGNFHTRLVLRFMNFIVSFRNILKTPSCDGIINQEVCYLKLIFFLLMLVLDSIIYYVFCMSFHVLCVICVLSLCLCALCVIGLMAFVPEH